MAGLDPTVRLSVDAKTAKPIVADLANYVNQLFQRVGTLRLGVEDKALQASLTRDYAELLRLSKVVVSPRLTLLGATRAQAELLGLDASLDAASTKIKAMAMAQEMGAASTFRWSGIINALTGKISLFGGALSAIPFLKSVAVWHALADVAVEFLAVLIPATVALIAFGAAGADTATEIVHQMQNVNTVVLATGKSLYPMTGQFTMIANAVRPEVYQLFGDMLTVVNAKTGQFTALAGAAGKVVDQLGARIAVAIQTGGLSVFLAHAVSDLAKLGDVVGNIFGTIGNLLKAMPGIAQVLLNVIDTTTKAIETFTASGFVQGIIKVGLAFHGAAIYIGLMATAAAFLVSRGLSGIASIAGKVAGGLAGMGESGAGAAIALDRFANGAKFAAALPWGWIALAAAALGFFAYKALTAKDATQQWLAGLEDVLARQNAVAGYTTLLLDQTAVAGRLGVAQTGLARAMKGAQVVTIGAGANYRDAGTAADRYRRQVNDLSAGMTNINNQSALYNSRLIRLGAVFGSVGTAQGLLIASGVTMNQMLKFGTNAWLQILQQVSATVAAYKAMGQTAGMLGADMNALNIAASDQVTQMAKLNTAFDTVMNIVQGGQITFLTFETNMKAVATASKVAGANMAGLSAPSLALRSAWQTAYTSGFKLVDALRNMTAVNSTASFPALTMAMKDTIAQLIPMGKQTAATRAEMVSLAQEVNPNIKNFQQLTTWLGNVHHPAQQLNDIAARLGINLQDLAKDASKLSSTMATQMNNTFSAARLAATGVSSAVKILGQDMGNTHTPMKQMQADAQLLYDKLVNNHIMAPKLAADFVTSLDPAFRKTGTAAGDSGAAHDVNVFASSMGTAQKKADAFTHGSPYKATVGVSVSARGKVIAAERVAGRSATDILAFSSNKAGALIPGYGGGDTWPAMLEPGETVVPKHLTPLVAPLMKQHRVPGFAAGGVVGGLAAVDKSIGKIPPWTGTAEAVFSNTVLVAFAKAAVAKAQADAAAAGGSGTAIANYAKSFLGRVPYVWGGTAVPGGADCSGFVETIYKHFGIFSPRTSEAQGAWVKRTAPTAGGLAFYNNPGGGPPPGHVAIIAADGSHVISQGGPLPGPTWTTLHGPGPLMWTGIPPHGFGLAGGAGGTQGQGQLESLWDQAGGAASLAHIMSAIAEAESGGNASARNPSGASGLWQILMPANARYVHGNVFNPLVNARAAVAIERAQGLNAWSTYTSGAYQHFMSKGGLVGKLMDRGGWIPPGASMVVNKTGRPEHLTPSGGGGADQLNILRRIERHLEAGNSIAARAPVQTGVAFGRTLQGVSARAVAHGSHSVRRPVA